MSDRIAYYHEKGYLEPELLKLTDSPWFHFMLKNAKSHGVPRKYASLLLEELRQREVELEWWKPSAIFTLDSGGMCLTTEPEHHITVGSLDITIRVSDVSHFASEIQRLPLRHFGRHPYYKLHGRFQCLVMTPSFKITLQRKLIADTDACEAEAVKVIDELRKRLDDIQAKTNFVQFAPRGKE